MTSPSAGSQSKDKNKEKEFLGGYIKELQEERIPEDGDRAMRGEVGDDIPGKMDRGVLKVWDGWPQEGETLSQGAHEVQ